MIMSMTTDKTLSYYKYINKWRLEKMRNKDIEHLVNRTVHKVGGKHVGGKNFGRYVTMSTTVGV